MQRTARYDEGIPEVEDHTQVLTVGLFDGIGACVWAQMP